MAECSTLHGQQRPEVRPIKAVVKVPGSSCIGAVRRGDPGVVHHVLIVTRDVEGDGEAGGGEGELVQLLPRLGLAWQWGK